MQNVETPNEFRKALASALKKFVTENEQFNVQGKWIGEDDVTVTVLADFSIEDYNEDEYALVSVFTRFSDNYDLLTKHQHENLTTTELGQELVPILKDSDSLLEAQNAALRAVKSVFDLGYGYPEATEPQASDIDVSVYVPVTYGHWSVKETVRNQ